jgi:hypothetical protein
MYQSEERGQVVHLETTISLVKSFLKQEIKKLNTETLKAFLNLYEQNNAVSFSFHQFILAINPSFPALKLFEGAKNLRSELETVLMKLDYLSITQHENNLIVKLKKEKVFYLDDFEFENEAESNRVIKLFNDYFRKINMNEMIEQILSILLPYCLDKKITVFTADEYIDLLFSHSGLSKKICLKMLDHLKTNNLVQEKLGDNYQFMFSSNSLMFIRTISPGLLTQYYLLAKEQQSTLANKEKVLPRINFPLTDMTKNPKELPNAPLPMESEVVDECFFNPTA